MLYIDKLLIRTYLDIILNEDVEFKTLGLTNSDISDTLTFIDTDKFVSELLKNDNIKGVITKEDIGEIISKSRSDISIIISTDPRYDFYFLQNVLTDLKREESTFPSIIDPSCDIHPTAYVSPQNVIIKENVVVQPNVTILGDVEIGPDTIIRAGVVIGAEGFEHKKTSKGILSVKHDGKVIIGSKVDIGANSAISKGFSFRNTIIGDESKLDNLVHIAHGVQLGKRCFLPAACVISGSVTIADDVWIGPNACISSQINIEKEAYVTLGAVVTRNVGEGERVTGNFAIPHIKFLRALKKDLNEN